MEKDNKEAKTSTPAKVEATPAVAEAIPAPVKAKEGEIGDEMDLNVVYKNVVSNFPAEIKPKFIALKHVADQREELGKQLEKEIDLLERKYAERCKPFYKLRAEIINGERKPLPTELGKLGEFLVPRETKDKPDLDMEELKACEGLPGFWLRAMQNDSFLGSKITIPDVKLLKHITNIREELLEGNNYRIIFTFSANEFFKNTELTKTMIVDKDDPEIVKESIGTEIEWFEGKNLTQKSKKKKPVNRKKKVTKESKKKLEKESFFTFFRSLKAPEESKLQEIDDEETEKEIMLFEDNIRIAEQLARQTIPNGLYYYLGLIQEDSDSDNSFDSEEEAKPIEKPSSKRGKKGK